LVSVNLFYRLISDLIRNVSALETVNWAEAPRFVIRPRNLGARFRLEDLLAGAPPMALRANVGLYRSRVEAVRGPDNRIDQQPRLSTNVGADYRWPGLPLAVGASLNWVPAYAVQQTNEERADVDVRRVADAFALWTFSPGTRLRLSLANLAPRRHVSASSIQEGGQLLTTTARGPTRSVATLRLELRL
jgi:outer membrane receptor for ferrienterochelin and colicins